MLFFFFFVEITSPESANLDEEVITSLKSFFMIKLGELGSEGHTKALALKERSHVVRDHQSKRSLHWLWALNQRPSSWTNTLLTEPTFFENTIIIIYLFWTNSLVARIHFLMCISVMSGVRTRPLHIKIYYPYQLSYTHGNYYYYRY